MTKDRENILDASCKAAPGGESANSGCGACPGCGGDYLVDEAKAEQLRAVLLDYFGTAVAGGNAPAMAERAMVEQATAEEIVELALAAGLLEWR